MADPLSITAAVVGIIGPALSGIRELLNDLQQFKDAPKTLKRLEDDLGTVNTSLSLLQGLDEKAWKYVGQGATEASSPLIIRCTQACNGFRTDLQKWSRHSVDGKFAAQDRANITFFKQGHIKSMMAQLQDCKLDISVMSNLAVLYLSARNSEMTEEIKKAVVTIQEEAKAVKTTKEKRTHVVEAKLAELNASSEDEDMGEPNIAKVEAIRQYQEEHKALLESQKLLDELLSRAQEEEVAKVTIKNSSESSTASNVTFGSQNSGFQTGSLSGGIHGTTFGRN